MKISVRAHSFAHSGRATTEEHEERIATLYSEILPLSGRVFARPDASCGEVALQIKKLELEDEELKLDERERFLYSITPAAFLGFSADIDVDPEGVFRSMHVPKDDEPTVLESVAKARLVEAVATLSLAVAIAHPSTLYLWPPTFESETETAESRVRWGDVGRGTFIAREMGWPLVRELETRRVLEWLERLPGWAHGVGQGRVGRAVGALSQALATERGLDSALSLVWAMIGLEALYCHHHEGLKAQLSTNVQLLLGRWSSYKKRFGKVYDYRSAFLHGSLDVPFAHRTRQDDDLAWRFIWDSDEEAGLAMVTLLASIQELIERGWHDLRFVTSIATSSDSL
jgi:hypothetical protein